MIKSGLIIGAVTFLLILGSSILITPICAPCLGLFFGLAAGFVGGVFDKPASSGEAVRKGGIAGVIAGSLGFVGGLIGGVVNGAILNPSSFDWLYKTLGVPSVTIDQSAIWIGQIVGGFCIGLFNIAWMAILGVAGGALWYQIAGKSQIGTVMPPQEPTPPGF